MSQQQWPTLGGKILDQPSEDSSPWSSFVINSTYTWTKRNFTELSHFYSAKSRVSNYMKMDVIPRQLVKLVTCMEYQECCLAKENWSMQEKSVRCQKFHINCHQNEPGPLVYLSSVNKNTFKPTTNEKVCVTAVPKLMQFLFCLLTHILKYELRIEFMWGLSVGKFPSQNYIEYNCTLQWPVTLGKLDSYLFGLVTINKTQIHLQVTVLM
jgi:hypothetical protein